MSGSHGVPVHKMVPGTGFVVDAFRHAHPSVKAYFLSHAHSDHYTGLSEHWKEPVYCSEVTGQLVVHLCGVRPELVKPLPLNTPVQVYGVEVTLVDANHCPGAVLLLFRLPDGRKYVHTGDMRYCPSMQDSSVLQAFRGCTALYLDTTYCQPRMAAMPSQESTIEFVAAKVSQLLAEDQQQEQQQEEALALSGASAGGGVDRTNDADYGKQEATAGRQQGTSSSADVGASGAGAGSTGGDGCGNERLGLPAPSGRETGSAGGRFKRMYLISTYTIGKERILMQLRKRTGLRICVTDTKMAVMRCIGLTPQQVDDTFTTDPAETPIHVVSMGFLGDTWPFFRPNFVNMETYRNQQQAQQVVGFCPTGHVTAELKKRQPGQEPPSRVKDACTVYLIPYSEHSSFTELQQFVKFMRPARVVPTVGVSGSDGDKAAATMLRHFTGLLDGTASKAQFLAAFSTGAAAAGGGADLGPRVGGAQERGVGEVAGAEVQAFEGGVGAGRAGKGVALCAEAVRGNQEGAADDDEGAADHVLVPAGAARLDEAAARGAFGVMEEAGGLPASERAEGFTPPTSAAGRADVEADAAAAAAGGADDHGNRHQCSLPGPATAPLRSQAAPSLGPAALTAAPTVQSEHIVVVDHADAEEGASQGASVRLPSADGGLLPRACSGLGCSGGKDADEACGQADGGTGGGGGGSGSASRATPAVSTTAVSGTGGAAGDGVSSPRLHLTEEERQLVGVLEVEVQAARQLLTKAAGDVSKAINLFYDSTRPQAGRAAVSSAASGSTAARAAGLGSPHSSQHKADSRKRPAAASPPASQGGKRSKGTPAASTGAARGGQGKGGTGGKSRGGKGMAGKPAVGGKGSAKVAGQASIKSFFGVPANLGSGTPAGGRQQQGTAGKGDSGVRRAGGSKTGGGRGGAGAGAGSRGGAGPVAVVDLVSDDDDQHEERMQAEVVEQGEQQVEARGSLDVPQELQQGRLRRASGGVAAVDFSALLFHTLGKGSREGTGAARGAGAVAGAGEEEGGAGSAGAAGGSGRWVGQGPSKASAPAAARGGTQSPPPAAALLPTSAPALATGLPQAPAVSLQSGLDADVEMDVAGGDGVPVVDHVDGQHEDHQQQHQQQQQQQQEDQQQERLHRDTSSLARAATQDALLSPVRPARSLAMPPAVLTPPTPRSLAMPSALSIPRSLGMPGAPSPDARPSIMAPSTGMIAASTSAAPAAGTPLAQLLPDRSALAACRQPAPGLATSAPQLQEAGKQAAPAVTSDLVKAAPEAGPEGVSAREEAFGGDPARQQRAQQQGHGRQALGSFTEAQEAAGAAGAFLIEGVTEPQAGSERVAAHEKEEDDGEAEEEEVLGSQQQASAQPTSPSLSPSAPLWTSRVQSQRQGRGQARGKGRGQGKGKVSSVAARGKAVATRGTKAGNAGGLQRAGASAAAQPSSAFFSNKKLGQQQEVDVVAAAGASHSQGDEQLGQAEEDAGDADAAMTDVAARGTTGVAGAAQHQDGVSGLATAQGGRPGAAHTAPGAPLPFAVPTPPTAAAGKATGSAAAGESSAVRGASKPHAAPATAATAQQLQQWRESLLLPVQQYEPAMHACWSPPQPVPYLHLALALQAMDATTKRLIIQGVLTNMFRAIMELGSQDEVIAALYLVTGKISPEYEPGGELGVGGATVFAALEGATGVTRNRLRELYRQHGDIGDVAEAARSKQKVLIAPAPLTVKGVLKALRSLSQDKGSGAQSRRTSTLRGLITACRGPEVKFLTRTVIANLRVGANWRSVIGPLAMAATLHRAQRQALLTQQGGQEQGTGEQLQAEGQREEGPEAGTGAGNGQQHAAASTSGADAGSAAAAATAAQPSVGGKGNDSGALKGAAGGTAKEQGAGRGSSRAGGRGLQGVGKEELSAAAAAAAEAFHISPSFDVLVPALLEVGAHSLAQRMPMTPGVPAKPMAARICEGVDDGLRLLGVPQCGPFLVEYKYDGVRAQIHLLPDGQVKVFSRNSEDNTTRFPDVCRIVKEAAMTGIEQDVPEGPGGAGQAGAEEAQREGQGQGKGKGEAPGMAAAAAAMLPGSVTPADADSAVGGVAAPTGGDQRMGGGARSLVIDAEVVGVDRDEEGRVLRLRAFQDLSTRARGAISEAQVSVHVCIFVFDLMYLDGRTLLALPLEERRRLLLTALPGMREGHIQLAQGTVLYPLALRPAPPQAATSVPQAAVQPATVPLSAAGEGAGRGRFTGAGEGGVGEGAESEELGGKGEDQGGGVASEGGGREGVDTEHAEGLVEASITATQAGASATAAAGAPPADETEAGAAGTGDDGGSGVVAELGAQVMDLLLQSFNDGAEGLMLKNLKAAYEPSKRCAAWIKVKKDYCEGLRDSLDLVPIGAWWGQGRKVKWLSPFLLACWDPVREEFQSVCRCMSGFSDQFYEAATQRLMATSIPGPKPYYNTDESPSVWFSPTEVWELRGADLTLSPVHKAAIGRLHEDRGVGLRFPRFIRLRPDKSPESATGPDEIVELFQKQTRRTTVVKGGKGGNGGGGGNSGHGGGGAGHGQRRPREESEEGEGAGEVGEVGEEEEASDKEDEGSSSGAEAEAKQQQAGGKQSKDENLFLVFMEDK